MPATAADLARVKFTAVDVYFFGMATDVIVGSCERDDGNTRDRGHFFFFFFVLLPVLNPRSYEGARIFFFGGFGPSYASHRAWTGDMRTDEKNGMTTL